MSKYFHSNEMDTVVSIDRIRSEFDEFQAEGSYLDESFDEYLTGCMYWNNGDLTPLPTYINRLKDKLRHYIHSDPDAVAELTAEIADLEKYKEE